MAPGDCGIPCPENPVAENAMASPITPPPTMTMTRAAGSSVFSYAGPDFHQHYLQTLRSKGFRSGSR
uniref:Uncharacterized protein n=1 Tax=Ralstonia solanacearum TaxID=305 RepID=A0A0S4U8X5_RALSL|nr:protein of unknown function [Ralstonia solanacearum]CUV29556.1 protein of unknown function [Ralstonia solanacearum]